MSKQFLVLLIGTLFWGVSLAQAKKPLDLPVCQDARAKTAYTGIVAIPDFFKADIAAYKKSWADLCDRKPGASLPQTLGMAKTLEEKFEPILWSAREQDPTANGSKNWENVYAVDDYFRKELPTFIPAFEGSSNDRVYFRPRFFDFKLMAAYGNAEDKLFFQLHADLIGYRVLPPWHGSIWDDHDACIKFGEYDWIQAFQKLKKTKEIKTVQYKKIIPELEKSLIGMFENLYYYYPDKEFNDICTCNKKDAVRTDLEKLVAYLKKGRTHNFLIARLQATLKAIKAGQIPVNSEAEKPCSTGE